MSSLKRKEGPDGTKSKRPTDSRPSKRSRPSDSKDDGKTGAKKSKDAKPSKGDAKPASAPTVSLLREEEPLFPRGGASVLTPLEQKQIQIEAKNDALFEQESAASCKKEKAKGKKRKSETGTTTVRNEDDVKIESLNFKVWLLRRACAGIIC